MDKTYVPKQDEIERNWYITDASGKTLGRLASRIATILRGKNKPYFTPHLDTGDFVIVTNAEKIRVTGNKETQKTYERYSGYAGGRKVVPFEQVMERHPERIIESAVWGMLPHNKLGRKILTKLKVYQGEEHPHKAQQPKKIKLL